MRQLSAHPEDTVFLHFLRKRRLPALQGPGTPPLAAPPLVIVPSVRPRGRPPCVQNREAAWSRESGLVHERWVPAAVCCLGTGQEQRAAPGRTEGLSAFWGTGRALKVLWGWARESGVSLWVVRSPEP